MRIIPWTCPVLVSKLLLVSTHTLSAQVALSGSILSILSIWNKALNLYIVGISSAASVGREKKKSAPESKVLFELDWATLDENRQLFRLRWGVASGAPYFVDELLHSSHFVAMGLLLKDLHVIQRNGGTQGFRVVITLVILQCICQTGQILLLAYL